MFLQVLCCIVVPVFLLIPVFCFLFQLSKSTKEHNNDTKFFGDSSLPEKIKEQTKQLLDDKIKYRRKKTNERLLNLAFGFASIFSSAIVLFSLSEDLADGLNTNHLLSYIFSFLSMLFILLALFISPVTRISDYSAAYRTCDMKVLEIKTMIDKYASMEKQLLDEELSDSNNKKEIEKIRSELDNAVQSISATINMAKEMAKNG